MGFKKLNKLFFIIFYNLFLNKNVILFFLPYFVASCVNVKNVSETIKLNSQLQKVVKETQVLLAKLINYYQKNIFFKLPQSG